MGIMELYDDGTSIPVRFVDPDELSEFFNRRNFPVQFSTSCPSRRIEAGISFHHMEGVTYCEDIYGPNATIDVRSETDNLLILLPKYGCETIQTTEGIFELSLSAGLAVAHSHIRQVAIHSRRHQTIMDIPMSGLIRAIFSHMGAPVGKALRICTEIDMRQSAGLMLQNLAQLFSTGLVSSKALYRSPIAMANLTESLIALTLTTLPHNLSSLYDKQAKSGSSWQLRLALDYMAAHAHLPLKVEDIAKACNLSVRSLYTLFKVQRDTTPKLHLRQIRLFEAYKDISNPDHAASIAHIARKWGFVNMGDFAALYHSAFGELPKDTMKRKTLGSTLP